MTGKGLGEGPEAPISIDIIHDDCAPRFQRRPRLIQLKANVALTVHTVVNEKINLAELRKHPGKAPPALTLNVCPTPSPAAPACHTPSLSHLPPAAYKFASPNIT